jgi:hypothetical protein
LKKKLLGQNQEVAQCGVFVRSAVSSAKQKIIDELVVHSPKGGARRERICTRPEVKSS